MVDALITSFSILFYIVIFVGCSYFMIYFSHEDDNNDAYGPKVVVVLGLTLSVTSVMMLPVDIASRGSSNGGLPMKSLWIEIYIIMAVWIVLAIPFMYFYYSEYEPGRGKKAFFRGVIYTTIFLIVFIVITLVSYFFLGVAEIPCVIQNSNFFDAQIPPGDYPIEFTSKDSTIPFICSFFLYVVAILSLFGGILFSLFTGIGFVSAPLDWYYTWKNRPKAISDSEFELRKSVIGDLAEKLIKDGVDFRRKSPTRQKYNNWRNEVFMLEEEWEKTNEAHRKRGVRVIWYWSNLFFCVVGILLTITWILHIFLYIIFDVSLFLNYWFLSMDGVFLFFGVIFYGIYSLYLEICVLSGNLNFSLTIPPLFTIHPMKPSGTLMNSFLFNVGLMCLSSVGCANFLAAAFKNYARNTGFGTIFIITIQNLKILKYVWKFYIWVLIGSIPLSIIYIIVRACQKKTPKLSRIVYK